jgi:hypothetical protein
MTRPSGAWRTTSPAPQRALRFDLIEGRNEAEIGALLDAAHRAVLEAFGVPERDRFC